LLILFRGNDKKHRAGAGYTERQPRGDDWALGWAGAKKSKNKRGGGGTPAASCFQSAGAEKAEKAEKPKTNEPRELASQLLIKGRETVNKT
jgi:hypothetical protein